MGMVVMPILGHYLFLLFSFFVEISPLESHHESLTWWMLCCSVQISPIRTKAFIFFFFFACKGVDCAQATAESHTVRMACIWRSGLAQVMSSPGHSFHPLTSQCRRQRPVLLALTQLCKASPPEVLEDLQGPWLQLHCSSTSPAAQSCFRQPPWVLNPREFPNKPPAVKSLSPSLYPGDQT